MTTKIPVYDAAGKASEVIDLELGFEKKDLSEKTYSQAVRSLLQNWRQGTVGCKTRGEVAFSNRKPWKQKGTGRARAGSLRSPLWRKGGIIFGPQPRTRVLDINKKQRKFVFNNILFSALENKTINCLDYNDLQQPSTKKAYEALRNMDLATKKVILFLPFGDIVSHASFRNIPNVHILYFDQPNAYDLTDGDSWVFLKKDIDLFKEMILQWN